MKLKKMNKLSIILLLFFGLVMAPASAFACGKGAAHSCKKEKKFDGSKSCCSNKAHGGQPCKGKCGHKSCGCSTVTGASASLSAIDDLKIPVEKLLLQSGVFEYAAPSLSAGFFTIWLIPKIS